MRHLAFIGTGYVGLVSGTMFASVGNEVVCIDKDPRIVEKLQQGTCTIHEPGLEEIMRSAIAEGTIHFSTNTAAACADADAIFIAVGTPSLQNGAYNFQYVEAAAHDIGRALRPGRRYIVVLKSTVTPDIYHRVKSILEEETAGTGVQFEIVSNPEFLAEGTAVRDFSQPSRVIVGANSPEAREFMKSLYAPFTKGGTPGALQFTDPQSAIVTKLAANSFLACRVALVNEVAQYCDAVGADIESVRVGLASDPRIGHLFLYAGPGYGGSCFGKDIRALRESAREHGTELSVLPAIEDSNNRHKVYMPQQVLRCLGSLTGKTIAVWGIAFKARTDDIRDSPAVEAIEELLRNGATVHAHDPQAMGRSREYFGDRVKHFGNKYDAICGANALLIMTEWDTYKSPDYAELADCLSDRAVFDARNILDPVQAQHAGLRYVGIGRRGKSERAAVGTCG